MTFFEIVKRKKFFFSVFVCSLAFFHQQCSEKSLFSVHFFLSLLALTVFFLAVASFLLHQNWLVSWSKRLSVSETGKKQPCPSVLEVSEPWTATQMPSPFKHSPHTLPYTVNNEQEYKGVCQGPAIRLN